MNRLTLLKTVFLNKWQIQRFQLIVIIAFLVWTPLLVTETLKVQHSCHPMIQPVNELSLDCPEALPPPNSKKPIIDAPSRKPPIVPPHSPKKPIIDSIKENPDLVGGTAAIAIAATVAVVTTAPLMVVIGMGAGVYFVTRTAITHLS